MKFIIAILSIAVSCSANASWSISKTKDSITNIEQYFAVSPSAQSITKMSFPYHDVSSWVGVGCDTEGNYWSYLGFSTAPNMVDNDTFDGYSKAYRQVRFDQSSSLEAMTQEWGGTAIHFENDDEIIRKIKLSNSMIVDMSNWTGADSSNQGYFRYSLSGSSKAISNILTRCAINIEPSSCKKLRTNLTAYDIYVDENERKEAIEELYTSNRIGEYLHKWLMDLEKECSNGSGSK